MHISKKSSNFASKIVFTKRNMMLQVKKYMKFLLAALLVFEASNAFAWTNCGTNLQYEIDGSGVLRFNTDPELPATIYSQAFINHTDIVDIVFPENLTEISSEAFRGCTSITDIVLPPALTSIGVEAFYGCSSLAYVLCRPFTAPALGNDGFTNCATGLEICVPNLGSYRNTYFWDNYETNLSSCSFLDEYDEQTTTAAKISAFRSTRTEIDLFRTLRKAGCFNTLTLPFNVPNITTSPLVGAEVYEFAGATVVDGALQLDITPLGGNTLVAGTPYLIQWTNTGEVMTRLSFKDISWDTDQAADNAGSGEVTYHGFYGKTHINDETEAEQHLNLFLGGGNQLYWPTDGDVANAKMLGFRAWFQINGSSVSGAPVRRGMPAMLRIVATPTAINETAADPSSLQGGEGGRLVLRNGQLVIIRNGQTFSLNGQRL